MIRILTYGTFDLLHVGHVRLLKRAKEMGDQLIVGVSTDEFNEIKGKNAINSYQDRKEILESVKYVDLVIPENNWNQKIDDVITMKIEVFVIGDDWAGEFDFLKEYCDVVYLSRTEDISTTQIKEIVQRNA